MNPSMRNRTNSTTESLGSDQRLWLMLDEGLFGAMTTPSMERDLEHVRLIATNAPRRALSDME